MNPQLVHSPFQYFVFDLQTFIEPVRLALSDAGLATTEAMSIGEHRVECY